jgi:hypothetical protein
LSFELLVGNALLGGLLGDLGNVSLDVLNPFAGVALALLGEGLVSSSSLLADGFLSGLSSFLIHSAGSLTSKSGVGVEEVQSFRVGEGVASLSAVKNAILLGVSDGALNFVGVDDTSDVGVGDLVGREGPALLLGASLSVGSEDVVKFLEGTLGPDNESSNMTARGELEEVESAHVGDLNSGDVPQSLEKGDIGSTVDNQRSTSAAVPSVSELSFSSANLDGIDDLLDISPGTDVLQESDGLASTFNLFGGVRDDERELGGRVDSVSSGLNERENSGGSKGSGDGVSFLLDVASAVPSPPDADGCEHSSLSAHVSEGTLAVPGSTRASNSGNTGHSSTSTPRLSGVLHTSMVVDGMTLSSVFGDVGVDEVDDIGSDSNAEHSGEDDTAARFLNNVLTGCLVGIVDVHQLSVDHGN